MTLQCWFPAIMRNVPIAKVVQDFRIALPGAAVFVYDNNSSDHTIQAAKEAGATVH